MSDVKFEIYGEETLMQALQEIKTKVATRAVRKGTRAAAKIFKSEVQSNILSMLSGHRHVAFKSGKTKKGATKEAVKGRLMETMREALRVAKPKSKQPKGTYMVKTEFHPSSNSDLVYHAKDRPGADGKRSYIPAAIEYGHDLVAWGHRTNKRVAPIPFYRKAFDTESVRAKDKAMQIMVTEIERAGLRA